MAETPLLTPDEIDGYKRDFDLASRIVEDGAELRREGRDGWRGSCPWCGGAKNPPFNVQGRPAWYYCHRCGASGDCFDYFRDFHDMGFRDALAVVSGGRSVQVSEEALRARRNEEAARERDRLAKLEEKRAAARTLWAKLLPIAGTLAERYLVTRGRGLLVPPFPASLRFAPKLKCSWEELDPTTGELKKRSKRAPALVGLVQASDRSVATLHRIWIEERPDGTAGKLSTVPPDAVKQLYGQKLDGAIRLGPMADHLVLAEGIETALAVRAALGERPGTSVWASIDSGQMCRLGFAGARPKRITIMADHDVPTWNEKLGRHIPPAGQTKAEKACVRFREMGIAAAWRCPAEKGDWLDVLIGECKA